MSEATLRVLTWNVHSCIGADGRLDPERVGEHIRAIDPDIAALQEVDSRRDRRDGFDLLGNCLGDHRAEVRTVRTPDGDYGHMLISRWPISIWREH
ncbi:MAG TPA: endonuclease/exonuclease/phosphatase family protein, partial [Woeseiaceae bacterium]|nr:endonuclease/exonuclease/phosphatase family protein [Woeseiaceae bacterium]